MLKICQARFVLAKSRDSQRSFLAVFFLSINTKSGEAAEMSTALSFCRKTDSAAERRADKSAGNNNQKPSGNKLSLHLKSSR